MGLTILSDAQVAYLLENLTVDELESFRGTLRAALHDYSNGTQSVGGHGGDDAIHQPERTSVHVPRTGATTLFMPSSSPVGHGVKVITLSSAENQDPAGDVEEDEEEEDEEERGKKHRAVSPWSRARSQQRPSPRPKQQAQTSATPPPPPPPPPAIISPTGAITLFRPNGSPAGILHARTLTAFRTALASLCLVQRRAAVRTITVFGAGEQAYWHVRLALLLRGATVRQVNIVNRRFSPRCRALLARLHAGVPATMRAREGWTACAFGVLTPSYGDYPRLVREQVRAADVVFCCTPSTAPLFDPALLTSREARRKGRLVVAVGSYTPAMRELPVELLHQATRAHEPGRRHFHKHAAEGGVVVVDTLDGALKEAGEVIEAGLGPRQLVELGELVMLQQLAAETEVDDDPEPLSPTESLTPTEFERLDLSSLRGSISNSSGASGGSGSGSGSAMSSIFASSSTTDSTAKQQQQQQQQQQQRSPSSPSSPPPPLSRSSSLRLSAGNAHHRRSSSHSSVDRRKQKDDELARWLSKGNVVYKSVGLGLMDLAVGMHLIDFAKQKGVGNHVEDF